MRKTYICSSSNISLILSRTIAALFSLSTGPFISTAPLISTSNHPPPNPSSPPPGHHHQSSPFQQPYPSHFQHHPALSSAARKSTPLSKKPPELLFSSPTMIQLPEIGSRATPIKEKRRKNFGSSLGIGAPCGCFWCYTQQLRATSK